MKVIITGTTGLVGEGVLLECLAHPEITQVLAVSRRSCGITHPKLKECIVSDFLKLDSVNNQLSGYDACFYCAGISSLSLNEAAYSHITYDIPMYFAAKLAILNPAMIFIHVSGGHTNGSEKGKIMWARVKGKTENALMRLPFKKVYNFRPGFMKPTPGQKNVKGYYKVISSLSPVLKLLFPGQIITIREVGQAMINSVLKGYSKQVLEIKDIKALAEA